MKYPIPNRLLNIITSGSIDIADIGTITDTEMTALYAYSLKKLDSGQAELAVTLLKGLTALRSRCAPFWRALGVAEQHLGHTQEALNAYARALELENDVAYIYLYRAELYLYMNNDAAAEKDIFHAYNIHQKRQLAPPLLDRLDQLNNILKQRRSPAAAPTLQEDVDDFFVTQEEEESAVEVDLDDENGDEEVTLTSVPLTLPDQERTLTAIHSQAKK